MIKQKKSRSHTAPYLKIELERVKK
jgi:hypothetical protein